MRCSCWARPGAGSLLLAADQDNAIVYQTGEPGGPEDLWFEALGVEIAAILDAAGIPFCKGGVMARNAQWRMSVDRWKATIDGWVRRQRPKDLLNVDIFFDGVPVHGNLALGEEIRGYAYDVGSAQPGLSQIDERAGARLDARRSASSARSAPMPAGARTSRSAG